MFIDKYKGRFDLKNNDLKYFHWYFYHFIVVFHLDV